MYLVCINKKALQILLRKCLIIKSPLTGSNRRPTDYKSVALPAELRRLSKAIAKLILYSNIQKNNQLFLHEYSAIYYLLPLIALSSFSAVLRPGRFLPEILSLIYQHFWRKRKNRCCFSTN